MIVKINNKETQVEDNSSIASLSAQIDIPQIGVAISVNNKIILRSEWDSFILSENDNMIIIKAACGG